MENLESIGFIEFTRRFAVNKTHYERLFNNHWPDGFSCLSCGHEAYHYVMGRDVYRCKKCRQQIRVKAPYKEYH